MRLLSILFVCCALLPPAAIAQTAPPMQSTPVQGSPQTPCGGRMTTTPPEQQIYDRFLQRLAPANLTSQQQTQIQQLVTQYSQTHPAGSSMDRPASKQLRKSIMALLTPQQEQALKVARDNGVRPPCAPRR
jgi:hypothetical protein